MIKIRKRDGRIKDYSAERIKNALLSAFKEVSSEECYKNNETILMNIIEEGIKSEKEKMVDIEVVQRLCIDALNEVGFKDVSEAFDKYRKERERIRNSASSLYKSVMGIVEGVNEEVGRENSNKDGSILSTQRDLIAGEISKEIAKNFLIPKDVVKAHDDGVLHYHDADYTMQKGMFNCCLINIQDMLDNGTVINEKMVESPKSFETACTIVTQIIAGISSCQYGGNSITIRHLAPYLRKTYDKEYKYYIDKYNNEELAREEALHRREKALKDGIQTIRYQLSTLQSTNGQSPFATIYLEIVEGSAYEEEEALICEEMIKQRLEGMKNYKGQEIGEAFPKLVYVLDKHNCLEGGKYDYITKLSAKCNVRRLVPDYQSAKIMRQNYDGDNFPPMGCRSHLSSWRDENGNLKWYGRFNQGVVSINLPQIGIIANGDMDKFWELFNERLELCKKALMNRHELLLGSKSDVSPIHWQHGGIARLQKGEKIDKYLKDGYSTISLGYVGLHELVQSMIGCSHTTEKGEEFALEVMNHLRSKCEEWKKETGLGFGLYGTPRMLGL